MKKLTAMVCCLVLTLSLTGCHIFYPHENYTETLTVALEAEPTSFSTVEPAVTELARQKDPNAVWVRASAKFQDDEIKTELGTLYFTYYSEDTEQEQVTTMVYTYDMATRTVTRLAYDQKHGKLNEESKIPVLPELSQVTFESLFAQIREAEQFKTKLGGANVMLEIEVTDEIAIELI